MASSTLGPSTSRINDREAQLQEAHQVIRLVMFALWESATGVGALSVIHDVPNVAFYCRWDLNVRETDETEATFCEGYPAHARVRYLRVPTRGRVPTTGSLVRD